MNDEELAVVRSSALADDLDTLIRMTMLGREDPVLAAWHMELGRMLQDLRKAEEWMDLIYRQSKAEAARMRFQKEIERNEAAKK